MAAPIGQLLSQAHGWRVGVGGFVIMALIILPAAWYAGRVDALPVPPSPLGEKDKAVDMARLALKHPPFAVMTLAYFVCGMQLVFLTTHLPSYLDLCGMDPMLSAQALGMIGGFNVLGSLFFGWAGGRYNKLLLLGGIYVLRSFGLAWYFLSVPTPENTLVFAAIKAPKEPAADTMPSTVLRKAGDTGREATAMAMADPLQAIAAPMAKPAPRITPSKPCARHNIVMPPRYKTAPVIMSGR